MRYLRWKRVLLALACSGFLFDYGCPTQTSLKTAVSNAGQTFSNSLWTSLINSLFNDALGTKLPV